MKEVLFLQEINMAPKAIPACIPLAYDAIARLNGKEVITDNPGMEKISAYHRGSSFLFWNWRKEIKTACSRECRSGIYYGDWNADQNKKT